MDETTTRAVSEALREHREQLLESARGQFEGASVIVQLRDDGTWVKSLALPPVANEAGTAEAGPSEFLPRERRVPTDLYVYLRFPAGRWATVDDVHDAIDNWERAPKLLD